MSQACPVVDRVACARRSLLFAAVAQGLLALTALLLWGMQNVPMESGLSWRKPLLFGVAVATTCLALRWVVQLQSPHWTLNASVETLGWGMAVESALVTLQCARGVPSHFNTAAEFDAGVQEIMGGVAVLVSLAIVVLTVRALRATRGERPARVLAAFGMVGLSLSVVVGYAMLLRAEGLAVAGASPAEVRSALTPLRHAHGAALHTLLVCWGADWARHAWSASWRPAVRRLAPKARPPTDAPRATNPQEKYSLRS